MHISLTLYRNMLPVVEHIGLLLIVILIVTIVFIYCGCSFLYLKCRLKRFVRIQFRKHLLDPNNKLSNKNLFNVFYTKTLCHLQKVNNELLAKILRNNESCAFFRDRSISFVSIDEFRAKVALTTYDDYRDYVDRIVKNGEKNVLTSDKIIYFATTSGTTGRSKYIPIAESTVNPGKMLMRLGSCRILMCLDSSLFPSSEQRLFQLYSGKKLDRFAKTKDGIPIGPLSLYRSAIPNDFLFKQALSTYDVVPFDLLEEMPDFETSAFVQLVFGLSIVDLYSYTVNFAPSFIHSLKIIEKYFEEISLCISSVDFQYSSLIEENITDCKLKSKLNVALNEVTMEYGGLTYRKERSEHIRKECAKKDRSGLLHRLWPNLIYASTVLGSSFEMYKNEIEKYCGDKLPLINLPYYLASEGAFGFIASISTDEYFLSAEHAFFEFIKEEDILETQPQTVLLSEIEAGHRYELVVTTEAGLVRYRMGDVIHCTRFLCRDDDDLVPLPSQPSEIPRIPLISMAYRIGSLLNVIGEKTTEEHVLYALQTTIFHWKQFGINFQLADFASFTKLDAFPVHYVIFFELLGEYEQIIADRSNEITQRNIDLQTEEHLRQANDFYDIMRDAGRLGPVSCILVRHGTFSIFHEKIFSTAGVGPLQVKGHRLLRQTDHIQYFYDNKLHLSS